MAGRDLISQIDHLLRPLRGRISRLVARGVVHLANDGKKLQTVQIGGFDGGPCDDAEHFQSYGFSSVPLDGAEVVVIFPDGDHARPFVVAASDRRHRPTGGQPGEVTVYNNTGAKITITKDGDIVGQPAPGREMYIRSEGGSAERLVKKSEFDGHTHDGGTLSNSSGTVTGATGGADAVAGTQMLQVE